MEKCKEPDTILKRQCVHWEPSINACHKDEGGNCPELAVDYANRERYKHQPYSTKTLKSDKHKAICTELSDIYEKGDSFNKLYEKYGMQATLVNLWDELYGLETIVNEDNTGVEEVLAKIANYCIMTIIERGE